MKPLYVTARIWLKTVFLNAFFWGIGALVTGDIFEVFTTVLLLIGGFIVTAPMIMLTLPLVKVSEKLPYGIPARIAWLAFYHIVVIILFYMLFSLIINNAVYKSNSFAARSMGFTIAGVVVSIITTRTSLNKLYTQS